MPKKGCSHGTRIVYKSGKSRCPSQKKTGPKTKRAFSSGANKQFKQFAKRSKTAKKSSGSNDFYYQAYRKQRVDKLKEEASYKRLTGDAVWDYVYEKLEAEKFPERYSELSESAKEYGKKLAHGA